MVSVPSVVALTAFAPLVALVAVNTRLFAVPVTSPFRVIPSAVEVIVESKSESRKVRVVKGEKGMKGARRG